MSRSDSNGDVWGCLGIIVILGGFVITAFFAPPEWSEPKKPIDYGNGVVLFRDYGHFQNQLSQYIRDHPEYEFIESHVDYGNHSNHTQVIFRLRPDFTRKEEE